MPAEFLRLLVLVEGDLHVEADGAEWCAEFVPGVPREFLQPAYGLGYRVQGEAGRDQTSQDDEQESDGSSPCGSFPQFLHVLLDRPHRRSQQECVDRAVLQPAACADDTYGQAVAGWDGPVGVICDDADGWRVSTPHHAEHTSRWVDVDAVLPAVLQLELQ